MMATRIDVLDAAIRIHELEVLRKDVADYLRAIPEEGRQAALVQAIEVGVFCLERATGSRNLEFVRRQVEGLVAQVTGAVGGIPRAIEPRLVERLGTGEGQVLAPIVRLVNDVSRTAMDRLQEVQEFLAQEIDPGRESSTLGKALTMVRNLLDPIRKDSIQAAFAVALDTVTAKEGPLAVIMKTVVAEGIGPLAQEVDKLGREIRGREAAAEALQLTTEKGATFEEEVVLGLQE